MNQNQEPIDTIRMGPKDKKRLIEAINRATTTAGPINAAQQTATDRRRLRVGFDALNIIVSILNPDGGLVRYAVLSRNLSSHGMAFIHGQFIHRGRDCEMVLPNLRGEWVQVCGRVRDCRHVSKLIHEVAVVFTKPIDVADFVILNPEQAEQFQEQVRLEGGVIRHNNSMTLLGHVLVVDDLESERKLLTMWLGKHGLTTHAAADEKQAQEAMQRQPMDLLIVDMYLGEASGLDVVKRIREGGYKGPIIAVSADDRDERRAAALAGGCNAFLAKPVDSQSLEQVAEQLLLFDLDNKEKPAEHKLQSQLAADPELRPLIQKFVAGLAQMAAELKTSLAAQDMGKAKTLCFTIKGAGGSYGFPILSRQARLALGQLQQPQPNLDELKRSVDELISLMGRVKG